MNADAPIENPCDDSFGYDAFARQLAPNLLLGRDASSLVAGVEAPWGSGKTSFLNLTGLAIRDLNKDALVLPYCPWLYSTVDALLLGFCVQLASELQRRDPKIYGAISNALLGLSYAIETPGSLPEHYRPFVRFGLLTVSKWTAAKQKLESINLENARTKIQKAISEAGRPVVIVIDDIDRLPPEEIRLLFQFLKAVADFHGVSYLVAYDPEPVERALSFDGTLDGKEYLKKFVQLPIRLPRISRLGLQRFFRDSISRMDEELQPPLTKSESQALSACVSLPTLYDCLQTPRDVVRTLNLFRMRVADCRNKVQLGDLLLFIMLDLICPEAIELVRENSHAFLALAGKHPEFEIVDPDSVVASMLDEDNDINARRNKLYSSLPDRYRKSATQLIRLIFLKGTDRIFSDVREARNPQGLIKLLYGGSSPLGFSVREATDFLENRNRKSIIEEKATADVLRQWIVFLSGVTQSAARICDPDSLAQVLLVQTCSLRDDTAFESLDRLIADYLGEVLGHVSDERDRMRFVEAVVGQETNLYASQSLLTKLANDAGLWVHGRSFTLQERAPEQRSPLLISPERVMECQKRWIRMVQTAARQGKLHEQPHLGFILHRWGQFSDNDYSEVQQYVAQFCESNDPLILLRHFALESSNDGLERIIANPERVQSRLSDYDSDEPRRSNTLDVMRRLAHREHAPAISTLVGG